MECKSEIFQGAAFLTGKDSLGLMSDGHAHEFYYAFAADAESQENTDNRYSKTQYFMYLPTSHNFDLQINAKLKSFQSDRGDLYKEADDSRIFDAAGQGTREIFDPQFFNFKVALKKLALLSRDLKAQDVKWTEEFTHDEQFDVLMQTADTMTGIQLFEMVNFQADPIADIILVKITGTYDPQYSNGLQHSELEVSFHMSASDVSYLAPGQTVRGAVSNDPNKYKIYEFYVNKMQFPEDTAGD